MNTEATTQEPLMEPAPQAHPVTVKDAIDLYDQHHLSTCKDPRSARCCLKNHFPPLHAYRTVLDVVAWSNEIRNAVSGGMARAAVKLFAHRLQSDDGMGTFSGGESGKPCSDFGPVLASDLCARTRNATPH